MAHRISVAPQLPGAKVYNPFEILGISSSLDEKAIKKHYKRLSLQ
jgi:translocation protein SEC63